MSRASRLREIARELEPPAGTAIGLLVLIVEDQVEEIAALRLVVKLAGVEVSSLHADVDRLLAAVPSAAQGE